MFCLSESDTFYLYPFPTDMRKSFYTLSGIVTNMKILHAEYGGLVIYSLKLEKGCISLPDLLPDDGNAAPCRRTEWQELMLMARGISPLEVCRQPRWLPSKSKNQKQR